MSRHIMIVACVVFTFCWANVEGGRVIVNQNGRRPLFRSGVSGNFRSLSTTCPFDRPARDCSASTVCQTPCPAYPDAECRIDICGGCVAKFFVEDVHICCQGCSNGFPITQTDIFTGSNPCLGVTCPAGQYCRPNHCTLPASTVAVAECRRLCPDRFGQLRLRGRECLTNRCSASSCPVNQRCSLDSCTCSATCVFGPAQVQTFVPAPVPVNPPQYYPPPQQVAVNPPSSHYYPPPQPVVPPVIAVQPVPNPQPYYPHPSPVAPVAPVQEASSYSGAEPPVYSGGPPVIPIVLAPPVIPPPTGTYPEGPNPYPPVVPNLAPPPYPGKPVVYPGVPVNPGSPPPYAGNPVAYAGAPVQPHVHGGKQ